MKEVKLTGEENPESKHKEECEQDGRLTFSDSRTVWGAVHFLTAFTLLIPLILNVQN